MKKLVYVRHTPDMTSRYKNCRALRDSDGNTFIESPPKVDYSEERFSLHVVLPSEVGRLDKIAFKYYNYGHYWWILAYANGFVDPFYVREGDVLKIPPFESIFRVRGLGER